MDAGWNEVIFTHIITNRYQIKFNLIKYEEMFVAILLINFRTAVMILCLVHQTEHHKRKNCYQYFKLSCNTVALITVYTQHTSSFNKSNVYAAHNSMPM